MSSPFDRLWLALQGLEREQRRPAPLAVARDAGWFDDWQARLDRVQRVRAALSMSGPVALRITAERLSGIDLSVVGDILLSVCKDIALVWGGSVLLGGAAGAALGALAGGVGAVPGAVAGAGVGFQAGAWVLAVLGLKSLVEDLAEALPQALRHYERGFRMAWGPVKSWEAPDHPERAPDELAEGHILLMLALLAALVAYLTRGRGDPAARARILQEIRQSPRLGPKVADWVAANEARLAAHPQLRPKGERVTMTSQAASHEPPITPSQARRLKEQAAPPPTPHPAPKVGFKHEVKRTLDASEANTGFDKPPYRADSVVTETVLKEDTKFVRLYDGGNSGQLGRWMMPADEIKGLSPAQIQNKFALPQLPTQACEVNVPAGTTLRFGDAGPIQGWGQGGGTQIQLMDRIPASSYTNPRSFP